MHKNQLIYNKQFGFKEITTEDAIFQLADDINNAFDKGEYTVQSLLTFKKPSILSIIKFCYNN